MASFNAGPKTGGKREGLQPDSPTGLPMKPLVAGALAAVALLSILAGCTTPAPAGNVAEREPQWALDAIFGKGYDREEPGRVPDHDHGNRSLHMGLSTPNFELVGHTELNSTYFGRPAGTAFCGDVSAPGDGTRQIAVVDSHSTDVALVVIDVTDRKAPVVLGELVLPYVFTYDSAVFADGQYAVIAANPDYKNDQGKPFPTATGAADEIPFTPMWRDACGTRAIGSTVDTIPYGYSTILVDLTDPENPFVADFFTYPAGRNVHSISTATIGDQRWVATSGLGALPCTAGGVYPLPPSPVPPPVGTPALPCAQMPRFGNLMSHFDFFTVDTSGEEAALDLFAAYTPSDQTHLDQSMLYLTNGHTDATIERHPVTNQTIAYMADWDGGLHIGRMDKADPNIPSDVAAGLPGKVTPVTTWGAAPGDDTSQNTGNIHTARPVEGMRDGHHYIIVGQEVVGRPGGRPSGQIALLDVTLVSQPIPVARWTLPVEVMWPSTMGLAFSTHYAVLVNDTLYAAAYHSGVWAIDARMENWPDLPSLGVYVPDHIPAVEPVSADNTPEVLEVLDMGDGNLLVYDAGSGAYVLRFHPEDTSVPPALPWPENPFMG